MSSHFGICETCGYTTNTPKHGIRRCPNGHGELLVIDHRYAKLINKKGDSGEDRLRKLRLLQKQWRMQDEERRIGNRKRIGTGKSMTIWEVLHNKFIKIK